MLLNVNMFALQNKISIKTIQADFQKKPALGIGSNYADVVLLCSTAMYFQSIDYFFSEARRMLKKCGIFAVSFMVRADMGVQNQQFIDDGLTTYVHSRQHITLVSEGAGFIVADVLDMGEIEQVPGGISYKDINYLFRKI